MDRRRRIRRRADWKQVRKAPTLGAPVRHRRPRARRPRARRVGRAHLDAGGRLLHPLRDRGRRAARPDRGLLPRPARPGADAPHGRVAGVPVPDPRHRPRDDPRRVTDQRDAGHRARRHADLHPPHARARALAKEEDYVQGARALGAGDAAADGPAHPPEHRRARCSCRRRSQIPTAIIAEAVLSFLGLGVQPPAPSLGHDAERRPAVPRVGAVDGLSGRASRSSSSRCRSTWRATASATSSTRATTSAGA